MIEVIILLKEINRVVYINRRIFIPNNKIIMI